MLEEGKQLADDEEILIDEPDLDILPEWIRVGVIIGGILLCAVFIVVIAVLVHRSMEMAYDGPAVILVSIDGFRWDYLSRNVSPNLQNLINTGVSAPYMNPIFPTKTFPNHYTLVTGLYAETHGIMANTFYDPTRNQTFFAFGCPACNQDGTWWDGGEPLWVTAVKQGIKAAAVFWPGSEAEIRGHRPTYYIAFNQSMPYAERVAQAMEWLKLPRGKRPRFVTMYFDRVDSMGHEHGPDSPEVNDAIAQVDTAIGGLLADLKANAFDKDTSIIIVADHGMTADSTDRLIFVDDYINVTQITVVDWSPIMTMLPKVPVEEIYDALYGAHPNLTVYYKNDIPVNYHYKNNVRVTPIVAVADLGWEITTHARFAAWGAASYSGGNHGFDPEYMDMKPIFIASGPAFKKGVQIEPVANTEVYNIVCHVLLLDPAPNNGTLLLPGMFA